MALTKVKGSGLATGAATASLVGIDDNATSTAITLPSTGKIVIDTAAPIDTLTLKRDAGVNGTATFGFPAAGLEIDSSTALKFSVDGNEKGRFLSGGGLTFNGDTAAANALDDYEEGTWEIVVKDSAGNLATTNNKTMNYTKIGRSVHVHGYFDLANIGAMVGTNTLQFYGLPFAAANTAGYSEASIGVFIPGRMTFSTTSQLFVTIDALNSHMNVRVSNSGGLQASHLVSDTGGTMYGTLSMTYTAA